MPVGWLEWGAQPAYALALVLLVLALFFGGGEGTAASTKSWLYVGPVHLQPAEVAKIATALMLARVLGEWREPPKTLWGLWKPIVVVMVPMGLVMLQPDLGSALVFASILVWCLFWAGTPLSTIFFLVRPILSLFLSINCQVWGVYIVVVLVLLCGATPSSARRPPSGWRTRWRGRWRSRSGTSCSRTRRTASWSSWTPWSIRAARGTT